MQRPRTHEEFLDLLDQANFEINETGGDELSQYLPIYQRLYEDLRALRADIVAKRAVSAPVTISRTCRGYKWKKRAHVRFARDVERRAQAGAFLMRARASYVRQ